jgi:hypothetical protein
MSTNDAGPGYPADAFQYSQLRFLNGDFLQVNQDGIPSPFPIEDLMGIIPGLAMGGFGSPAKLNRDHAFSPGECGKLYFADSGSWVWTLPEATPEAPIAPGSFIVGVAAGIDSTGSSITIGQGSRWRQFGGVMNSPLNGEMVETFSIFVAFNLDGASNWRIFGGSTLCSLS